ncbi:hypothetical protein GW756_02045 [bacterium]|nr:hypothetical protein [bacterium]NCQ55574.1 hypothetical protein [Candidatus Parcubacteria bacterium]NCS67399.1 hypothetical protein [Candidatus Peregrinibacteria bacterium]NCS96125.1 hypothetical protein [bacterium]
MLSKYRLLATLLILCYLSASPRLVWANWQKLELQTLINPGLYLSKERWRINPSDIVIPAMQQVDYTNQCYQKRFENFLKTKIINKPLKIKFSQEYSSQALYREGQIKFEGKYGLAEILLENGWAQLSENTEKPLKPYHDAQIRAQVNRRGLWGECDHWYNLRERQRLRGLTNYLAVENRSMLSNVSTGWVSRIISPDLIELSNGQKIKLQALGIPKQKSELQSCWQDQTVKELESLLLGKKVRLEKDQLQLTTTGRILQRYVWLEGNRWQSPLFINEHLISHNLALLDQTQLNLKYVDRLKSAALSASQENVAPDWWLNCSSQIIKSDENNAESKPPLLEFDPDCPIKGNVAGSKKNPKKTFHTPASGWYKRIEAEQCFADEAAAKSAGFEKVK